MSFSKLMYEIRVQAQQDKTMLEGMAESLRSGSDFSFDPYEMADLLDRLRKEHVDHMA